MPLYEYECEKCQHRFEKIQKFSDPLVDTCPKCGGPVHKLMSSPAIQFKGTGWYITDYAKKDSTAAGKTGSTNSPGSPDTKSESSSEKNSESSSEKKAAAKTDTAAAKTETSASKS